MGPAVVAPTPVKIAFDVADTQGLPPVTRNGLQNYRCKRQDTIPGWFDRWNFFGETIKHSQSIASITDEIQRTACRRRVVLGIAIHLSAVTGLACLLVYVRPIAHALHQTSLGRYGGHNERLGLATGAVVQLLALKLVFDIPQLRSCVFASYTITVALLFATTTIAIHGFFAVVGLVLATSDWWLRWWLYGVQIRGGFLSTITVAGTSFVVVTGALISLLATTTDGNSQLTLVFGLVFEFVNAILGTIEVSRLFDTLSAQEAAHGVYFLNLDLLVGFITMPLLCTGYALVTTVTTVIRWLWRALVWLVWMPWWLWECMDLTSSVAVAVG